MSVGLAQELVSENGRIRLRLAESVEDVESVKPLCLEFHASSRYSDIPYSHEKRRLMHGRALDDPKRHALIIAELKGQPVGYLFCSVSEYIVGTDVILCSITAFYVGKKYRESIVGGRAAIRMLNACTRWARVRQAREIMVHVISGIDINRTDKFLRRGGFKVIGANYAFNIEPSEGLD